MKKKLLLWCLPIVSALILTSSLDSPWSSWMAFFGFVPFLVFLAHIRSKKSAFFGGWLAGSVFFLWNIKWFLVTHPEAWTGVQNAKTIFLGYFVVWFATAVVLGLCFALFALVCFLWRRKQLFNLFFIPSIWIITEYLRAWLFSIWSWGPESLIGPYWTFGNLGYAFINTPSAVLARYVGLYGLSFLVVFINVLIFQKRIRFLVVFLFIVFIFVPLVAPEYSSDKKIRADVLQTNTLPLFYYKSLTELLENNSLPENTSNLTHIFVFPEGSNFFSIMTPEAEEVLDRLFSEKEQSLIISSAVFKDEELKYEKSIYRSKDGEVLSMQKKSFLVPTSEYLPYLLEIIFRAFDFGQDVMAFGVNRHYSKAETWEEPVSFANIKVGTLICSGVASPVFYRRLTKLGAEVLVNSSSHAYFSSSRSALFYMETYARFQAIANARPFLQASEGDYSFIIDANGNFVKRGFVLGNQILSGEVGIVKDKTLYTKLGDWPVLLAFFLVLLGVCCRLRYNRIDDKRRK